MSVCRGRPEVPAYDQNDEIDPNQTSGLTAPFKISQRAKRNSTRWAMDHAAHAIFGMGAAVHLLDSARGRLSEFRSIFAGNLVYLLPSQLLWRYPRRTAGVAEEAVQAGRSHDPE